MSTVAKALSLLVAFLVGAVVTGLACALFVKLTYHCQDGPPCDAGGMTLIGMFMLLVPLGGLVFSYFGYRLLGRRRRDRNEA
jgi:Co/Zn/Cd efflux system component